jgi:hypothetical protein
LSKSTGFSQKNLTHLTYPGLQSGGFKT